MGTVIVKHSYCLSGTAPRRRIVSVGVACTSFSVFSSTSCLKQAWLLLTLSGLLDEEVRLRGKTVICIGHRLGGSERCATPLCRCLSGSAAWRHSNLLGWRWCSQSTAPTGLCLNAEAHEHRSDLVVREEREGHEFPDEPVRCFIATVYSLEAKLLHLKKLKFVPLRKTYD